PSVPEAPFVPGAINENAAKRLRRRAEEMSPILPIVAFADEPNPRLMDQRRGLKRLSAGFLGHASVGELAQFFIDQRQKVLRCLRIPRINGVEQLRYVGHEGII